MHPGGPADLKALVFDVFGTTVDWRTSIISELYAIGDDLGLKTVDWVSFTDDWRAAYQPNMQRVREGSLPWTSLDDLHRMELDRLIEAYRLPPIPPAAIQRINTVWHRLKPWPDTLAGLHRLKQRFIIAPLSNGNVALLTAMAKSAGLPWDLILSAELCRHYKPDPETYRMPCDYLALDPRQVMLVAAHNGDLAAAAREGLRTAFVRRPTEYGPRQTKDLRAEHAFDVAAEDFMHLADILLEDG